MELKTDIIINDIDAQCIAGIEENKQTDFVLKVISSFMCGASSNFAFGIVKSIPSGRILKNNDELE